jgi:hypothetical protein
MSNTTKSVAEKTVCLLLYMNGMVNAMSNLVRTDLAAEMREMLGAGELEGVKSETEKFENISISPMSPYSPRPSGAASMHHMRRLSSLQRK